jgi:hypothetical protein
MILIDFNESDNKKLDIIIKYGKDLLRIIQSELKLPQIIHRKKNKIYVVNIQYCSIE